MSIFEFNVGDTVTIHSNKDKEGPKWTSEWADALEGVVGKVASCQDSYIHTWVEYDENHNAIKHSVTIKLPEPKYNVTFAFPVHMPGAIADSAPLKGHSFHSWELTNLGIERDT